MKLHKNCIYANKFITNLCDTGNKCQNTLKKMMELIHPDDKNTEIEICQRFLSKKDECQSTFRIFNKNRHQKILVPIKLLYLCNIIEVRN